MNTGDDVFNEIEKTFGPDLTNQLPGDDSTASEPSVALIEKNNGVLEDSATYKFKVFTTGNIPSDGYFTLQIPESISLPSNAA